MPFPLDLLSLTQMFKKMYARMCEPVLAEYALSQLELDILLFLANNPHYDTASDIVEKRKLTKSHVSLGVEQLIQKGLIERIPDVNDRRLVHLRLLAGAAAITQSARSAQEQFIDRILAGFTDDERRALEGMLFRMMENAKG